MKKKNWGTVVIGGGQAGLAAGYYLKKIHEDFIILDEGARTGDRWRQRWDSLALFTPAEHDSLPGFPFPSPRGSFPTKDDMAEYLEEYARKFSLPIQFNTGVTELSESGSGYRIITSKGELFARQVIVATGTNPVPYIPEFAKDLDPKIARSILQNIKIQGHFLLLKPWWSERVHPGWKLHSSSPRAGQ
jgi:putative flavoprotein involved in K+ transport